MSAGENADLYRWFPLCARQDLPPRHVMESGLKGRELAVWRGRSGTVNVWENRCPHRGMRLTLGANLGDELRCAYHGYRFADGSGLCTSVPAQPDRQPPRSLCASVYPTLERGDLVWTRLGGEEPAAEPAIPAGIAALAMYAVSMRCAPAALAGALADYRFRPSAALLQPETAEERCSIEALDGYSFRAVATQADQGPMTTEVRLFLQPVDDQCTVVHAVLLGDLDEALRLPTLEHHAMLLTRLRDAVERAAPAGPTGPGGSP
jgi:nitrite reductase/ring-hydroxylating ferredoxin subunit